MKYFILILFFGIPSVNKAQNMPDRWLFLYSEGTKSKTYVDTKSVTISDFIDGHNKVFIIWVRTCSKPYEGEWVQQDDQKLIVDVSQNQFELKAIVKRYNGKIIEQKEFYNIEWVDALPETNGETFINFCKEIINSK